MFKIIKNQMLSKEWTTELGLRKYKDKEGYQKVKDSVGLDLGVGDKQKDWVYTFQLVKTLLATNGLAVGVTQRNQELL